MFDNFTKICVDSFVFFTVYSCLVSFAKFVAEIIRSTMKELFILLALQLISSIYAGKVISITYIQVVLRISIDGND